MSPKWSSMHAAARSQKNELESKARFIRDLLKRGANLESADVINSELHGLPMPAHGEIVIEGEIMMDDARPEPPAKVAGKS